MSVVSMMVGAVGSGGATFAVKVDGGGPVRVAVADNEAMTNPTFTGSEPVDGQGVAKASISGLDPSTRYWWQVEDDGDLDTSVTGQFLTHPPLGSRASFTVAMSGDAGLSPEVPGFTGTELLPNRISNHQVFDTIRQRAVANDWLAFVHLGDILYYNFGDTGGGFADDTLADYRRGYDDLMLQPNQARLYREVPLVHIIDDHEFGPNDSDGTHTGKDNFAQVYRERDPHYPLAEATGPTYHSFQVGRVLFIMSDVRYDRSPNSAPDGPSKTMLGQDQKDWMDDLLATSDAEFLVWCMGSQWLGTSSDSWASFQTERNELVGMFNDRGWLNRMMVVYGDHHGIGIDSGASNAWGGFPVLMAASLDATPSGAIDPEVAFDVLNDQPGRDQYATLQIIDIGNLISVRIAAWRGAVQLGTHQFGVPVDVPGLVQVSDIAEVTSGSIRPVFEARVLSRYQVGDDPVGEQIEILGGDVTYDATADVFATLELETEGTDDKGDSRFPRRASDLLAPFGREVFVRAGVDIGSTILWSALGYFRLDTGNQPRRTSHPLSLSCSDRMQQIIDSDLVRPITLSRNLTVATAVSQLVTPVYPNATIVFDDSGGQMLGQDIVVEENRYDALLDIVESLGKIAYFDGEGILRIEDAPDPDDIVWSVRAGRDGVLVEASREVTRIGMHNGWKATGEGDQESLVVIVVDVSPTSPTRWFPPDDPAELWFGQIPGFTSSPLFDTGIRARRAAEEKLRRHIGMPHVVTFGVVPNYTLRPRQAVEFAYDDNSREKHIIETLTVPLVSQANMTGTTREQTLVQIGQL